MYGDTRPTSPRRRDPEQTRARLLSAAFAEMHLMGFRGAGLDTILERAGVTKGALYHHFDGKQGVGYAVVEEVIGEVTRQKWTAPLAAADDPLAALIEIIAGTSRDLADLERGCPLNNFMLEMAPLDEGFRLRTAAIFTAWGEAIAGALRRGQSLGLVATDVDPDDEATFLIAAYEGYICLAKNAQDAAVLEGGQTRLIRHLKTLRA
jgi:TetR/AcrR family transcriptional repressor of nem operon